jgi:hypothetical protein
MSDTSPLTFSISSAPVSPAVFVSFVVWPFVVGVGGDESVASASKRSISFRTFAIF